MAKNLATVAVLLASLVTGSAMAAYEGPGVAAKVTDAKTAQRAADHTPVEMQGFIVRSLGDENYIFRDANGNEVTIDLDDQLIQPLSVNENTPVLIIGEVDSDWNSQEVEVSAISLLPANAIVTQQAKKHK